MSGTWSTFPIDQENVHPYRHWFERPDPGGAARAADDFLYPYAITFADFNTYQSFVVMHGPVPSEDVPASPASTGIILPVSYDRLQPGEVDGPVDIIVFAPRGALDNLRSRSDIKVADEGIGLPSAWFAEPKIVDRAFELGDDVPPADSVVVTAIIDVGIGFAHERFRKGLCSSRIEYFWDMAAKRDDKGMPLGREYGKRDIDCLLSKHRHGEQVDERSLYADFLSGRSHGSRVEYERHMTHGTSVLNLAAGFDYTDPDEFAKAARNPIFAVQLPLSIAERTHGAEIDIYLICAVDRILERASAFAEALSTRHGEVVDVPVILNISFGGYAGRHDGHSQIERFLDSKVGMSALKGISLPVGNSYQSATHARWSGQDLKRKQTIEWHVQPASKAPAFMQIWMPAGVSTKLLKLTVTPPGGEANPVGVTAEGTFQELQADQNVQCRIYAVEDFGDRYATPHGGRRGCVTVAIQQTASDDMDAPLAPAGVWKLELSAPKLPADAQLLMWIERGDSLSGSPKMGRQSYFSHPEYKRYGANGSIVEEDVASSPIKRHGTISAMATGEETLVVAGIRASDNRPARYSSAGVQPHSTNVVSIRCPDVAAVTDASPAIGGTILAGTLSGSTAIARGTSFASPQGARRMVHLLQCRTSPSATPKQLVIAETAQARRPNEIIDPSRLGAGPIAGDYAKTSRRRQS